jgi:hypothetical protein
VSLQQRLAYAGDVAVPEDAKTARHQAVLDAVTLAVLIGQEPHQRLGDGEANGGHCQTSSVVAVNGIIVMG